jgi:hypothetical protein
MHQLPTAFQSDLTNLGQGRRDKRGPCADLAINAVRLDALNTFLRIFFVSRNRLWQLIWSDHDEPRGASRKYFQSANHTNLTGPAFNITEGFAGLRRLALCQARLGATTRCDLKDSAPCTQPLPDTQRHRLVGTGPPFGWATPARRSRSRGISALNAAQSGKYISNLGLVLQSAQGRYKPILAR